MNNVCVANQDITDKFKHLDDKQYQSEHKEHCRKMSVIDSYEGEIKDVLFLSSGCVAKISHSYEKFGLGMKPDYIDLENLVDKIQHLKATNLGLKYIPYNGYTVLGFVGDDNWYKDLELDFIGRRASQEYTDYLIEKVNHYSKKFYNKEYFLRCEGSLWEGQYVLVTKDETWKMEYLRNSDTLHSWKSFTIASLIPVFGWMFLVYSTYVAISLYFKHRGKLK